MKYEPKLEKEIMCPIEEGLNIFGGKWKSRIICVVSVNNAMR
jgi:DNA-binding HxlR family transcriptional regulator